MPDDRLDEQKDQRQRRRARSRRTDADRMLIWERREKAAELYARGRSFSFIASTLGVAVSTAWQDVRTYFREAARYYKAPVMREQIAAVYRAVIREASQEHRRLGRKLENADLRLRALDRMVSAADAMRATYGLSGANTFHLELPASPAQLGASETSPSWVEGLPRERIREIRDRLLAFYGGLPRSAVPAEIAGELAVEAEAEIVPESRPPPPERIEAPPAPSGPVEVIPS